MATGGMDLEAVGALREEQIYPQLFGSVRRGAFALEPALFTERLRQAEIDPRWLSYGVFEFAPTPWRRSWAYVTSGLSNPWDQPPETYEFDETSGAGLEFVFESALQGDWAIRIVQNLLAYDLLIAAGRFPGRAPLAPGDRIPLGGELLGGPVRHLVAAPAEGRQAEFALPSGKVGVLAFTGATDAEAEWARSNGSAALIDRLRKAGAHPVTDPRRASIL